MHNSKPNCCRCRRDYVVAQLLHVGAREQRRSVGVVQLDETRHVDVNVDVGARRLGRDAS